MKTTSLFALAAAVTIAAGAAQASDQIKVVRSSAVCPYSQPVSEAFARTIGMTSPAVDSTGTGGTMKIVCGGMGEAHPDVTGASRATKGSEHADCVKNGATDITEVLLGYDGLSIAVSRDAKHDWALTEAQIYLALAVEVPVNGEWKDNPYRKWSGIDPSLPYIAILAYGSPPTSGTRDTFVELPPHDGCTQRDFVKAGKFSSKWINVKCSRMRTDGLFVEVGENDNLIVQRLEADPNAPGIFGYSFLHANNDKPKGVPVNGIEPSFETIADSSCGIARPICVYIKNTHRSVIPGPSDFIAEFASDNALSPDGCLAERGLTPLSDATRAAVEDAAPGVNIMDQPAS